jgi:hypothetical protein
VRIAAVAKGREQVDKLDKPVSTLHVRRLRHLGQSSFVASWNSSSRHEVLKIERTARGLHRQLNRLNTCCNDKRINRNHFSLEART